MATLTKILAILGGISLLIVILLTCASVAGRALDGIGLKPVPGDIELVEFGIGFAVFSSLPYAQFIRSHASVDLFKRSFGHSMNLFLDLVSDLFLLVFSGVITWRLYLGMLDKGAYGETTFILQIPLVWGYCAAFLACSIAVITAVFCVLRSTRPLIGKGS